MQQPMQPQPTTFEQKINIVQNLALFPALISMIFLRRKLGYRFLDLMKVQIIFVLLLVYSGFSTVGGGAAAGGIMTLFAFAVLIVAIIERRLRWNDIKKGVSWHSYSRGVSWFNSFLPLNETIVKRFIDPIAALVIGGGLFFLIMPLGLVMLASAVCLFIFETIDFQKQIDQMLDMLDSLVESEIVSSNADYYQGGAGRSERPVEETAGIPTGVSPDLATAIERKRRRQQSQPLQPQAQRVTSSLQATPLQPAAMQVQGIQQQQGIPVIKSIDDPAFAALPSGARFVTPDGKTRWKN
jgi:hypothetical protein